MGTCMFISRSEESPTSHFLLHCRGQSQHHKRLILGTYEAVYWIFFHEIHRTQMNSGATRRLKFHKRHELDLLLCWHFANCNGLCITLGQQDLASIVPAFWISSATPPSLRAFSDTVPVRPSHLPLLGAFSLEAVEQFGLFWVWPCNSCFLYLYFISLFIKWV